MPSYISYKNNLKAILDADDTEIESWITVRGNHIPIKKGQTKEEAVKSFIEQKSKGDGGKHYITTKEYGDTRYVNPKNNEVVKTKSEVTPFGSKAEAQSFAHKLNHTDPYANTPFATKNYERKQFPFKVESESSKKEESSGWTERKGGSIKTFNNRKELMKELWDAGYEVDNIGELDGIEFAWKDGIIYSFRLDKQSDGTIEVVKSKRAEATKAEFVDFLEKQHDYGDSDDDYYDDDDNDADNDSDVSNIESKEDAAIWLNTQVKKHGNTYFWNENMKSALNKLIEKFGNTYFWNK